MINAPTVVRLIRFPKSLRLEKKGNQFIGPRKRSGPLILSEKHAAVECTFRVSDPGLSFSTGGNTVSGVEAFAEGETRDLLLPWQLVADGRNRPKQIILEIDVNYEGAAEKHTATESIALTYGVRRRVVGAAVAATAAAVAVAAATRGRRKNVVIDDDDDVEASLFNVPSTSRTRATSARTDVKGAKVRVMDEEDVDLAVFNVPATRRASSKKISSKKASAKKASTKKAPAKKAGGSRRGSAASRSVPRKGARGSSKARKSSARRSTRKSR